MNDTGITVLTLVAVLALGGCDRRAEDAPSPDLEDAVTQPGTADLDAAAESYVRLVLAVGQHNGDDVDAYYGPEAWRTEAGAEAATLDAIRARAAALVEDLGDAAPATGDEMVALRWRYLRRQLQALIARVDLLGGADWSFEQEARALYDAAPPVLGDAHFQAVLDELGRVLAEEGFRDGSLTERWEAFRADFVIPPEKLDAVFRRAIDDCRRRTAAHLELPEGESFRLEYVTDKPWSGYNWYQGGYQSLIQVNTDLPIHVDRAVDLACHEGYPGHHLYNALLEQSLVRGRGWVELSVYPLFSPQSLIAEGSANLGIEMAFPGDERLAYERDVLFPLAGLDASRAAAYHRAFELVEKLSYASNEAARRYLDGEIDAGAAAAWLERYAAMSPERAAQRVKFIDKYRSYVINYNLGQDLVRAWVDGQAGDDPAKRWEVFGRLLSSPRLPSGLE